MTKKQKNKKNIETVLQNNTPAFYFLPCLMFLCYVKLFPMSISITNPED